MKEIIPYSRATISGSEAPRWEKGEFLCRRRKIEPSNVLARQILMPEVSSRDYVNQAGKSNFREFEIDKIVKKTGYAAEEMRKNGCGISSLFMILSTLSGKKFRERYNTVGDLAIRALSYHKNDLIVDGNLVKLGTPVFNLKAGWYHDAMLYVARSLANIDGCRYEEIGLDETAKVVLSLIERKKKPLCIISVQTAAWFKRETDSLVSTHLFVINGFGIGGDGKVSKIRVVDPYSYNGDKKMNEWVEANDEVKRAFRGRSMFFWA